MLAERLFLVPMTTIALMPTVSGFRDVLAGVPVSGVGEGAVPVPVTVFTVMITTTTTSSRTHRDRESMTDCGQGARIPTVLLLTVTL